jgi:hypothetical protein
MERQLTVKQRRFALGVASGLSKTAAYGAAYPNNMKRGTRETAAKQAAKNPRVKAEIARLTLELLPPVEDLHAAYEHAFSAILKLTLESRDDRVRFDAARWLRAEVERQEQKLAATRPEPEAERMLAALRALYARIEGCAGAPVQALEMVTEVADADGSPAVPTETTMSAPEVHAEAEGSEMGDDCSDTEKPSAQPEFRRVPIPGHHPPKFKTIRVK